MKDLDPPTSPEHTGPGPVLAGGLAGGLLAALSLLASGLWTSAPALAQEAEGGSSPAESSPASSPGGSEGGSEGAAQSAGDPAILSQWQWPEWTPDWMLAAAEWIQSHPLSGAFALAVGFWLLAKLSEVVMRRGIARLTATTSTDVDDRLLDLLQRPVFLTVFFFGLSLATRALQLPRGLMVAVIGLLMTLVVLSWLGASLPALRLVLDALGRHSDRFPLIEERTIPLFDIVGKLVLIGGGGFALFGIWGIDPTPWFASAGVVGIAVGFAARDTLANLFAGIFIIADSPYKLGDFVTLDSGERGLVTHVGIRSTRLLTRDDVEITLPNSVIGNAKILNESGGRWEKERIRLKVGVAYGVDVDRICEILVEVAKTHDHICSEPTPRVRLRRFGDSSLDFELLCWIDEPVLRGRLSHEMYMDIYKAFEREGVEIPFPQRDLWVRKLPAQEPGASRGPETNT